MSSSPADMKTATPDLQVSHAVINYLNAGYQGKFAYLNILSQLKFKALNPEEMGEARNALDRINIWLEDLKKGVPLFKAHWNYPDSHESQKAVELLEVLRDDLTQLSNGLIEIFGLPELKDESEELKKLVAAYGRFAYSRDNYVRQIVSFGETFAVPELVQQYKPFLSDVEEDIQLVHTLLSSMRAEGPLDQQFFDALLDTVLILPGTFLTHAHDIRQLLAPYQGGFDYEYAGIPDQEAKIWEKLNVSAAEAGYWRSYSFAPADAVEWKYSGFDHTTAAKWKVWGFSASAAAPWYGKQFPLNYALLWSQANFNADEALELMKQGYMNPADVPQNMMPARMNRKKYLGGDSNEGD